MTKPTQVPLPAGLTEIVCQVVAEVLEELGLKAGSGPTTISRGAAQATSQAPLEPPNGVDPEAAATTTGRTHTVIAPDGTALAPAPLGRSSAATPANRGTNAPPRAMLTVHAVESSERPVALAADGHAALERSNRRIDSGAVTATVVAAADADKVNLVLGRGAVVTPNARDRARKLGVDMTRDF